jgi:Xaa-Pro aminopeptidase
MAVASPFDHASRRERLRSLLVTSDLELLVVSRGVHVRYLTGFTGDSTVLLVGRKQDLLVSDGRYTEQLARECAGLAVHVRPSSQKLVDAVPEVIRAQGVNRVGVESASITLAEMERWRELLPAVAWKSCQGLVEGLRVVKDARELQEIQLAVELAQKAYTTWRHGGFSPGTTEKQASDQLEFTLRGIGAQESAFPLIIAGDDGAALPHYHPTAKVLPENGVLLVDWGAQTIHGYKSDLTRTTLLGKGPKSFPQTPELEPAHQAVRTAQLAAIPWLKPGVECSQVDKAVRESLAKVNLEQYFVHGTGHGFGLEIHEAPWFRHGNPEKLQAGMVVTIEPGVYFPERWGIRVEDDFLVTPEGGVCLSDLPRGLELGPRS